eukprot:m.38223 g.38223  ORF g.38223 m.38223 type:complete len:349 (-) comp9410_c0_seq1:52-1098(-)
MAQRFEFKISEVNRVRRVTSLDTLCVPLILVEPILVVGGAQALTKRWSSEYILSTVQDELEVTVDRVPRPDGKSCDVFPDTKSERAALGVEEITISFQDLIKIGESRLETKIEQSLVEAQRSGEVQEEILCRKCYNHVDQDVQGAVAICSVCGFRNVVGRKHGVWALAKPSLVTLENEEDSSLCYDYYMQQQSWPFKTLFPELFADLTNIGLQCLRERIAVASANVMWLGTGKTRSQLHKDRKDNVIVQICGMKRVLLWPPELEKNMYPRQDADGTHFEDRFSQVSLTCSQTEVEASYPTIAQTAAISAEVNEGDALLIPANWWHQVDSQTCKKRGYHLMVNSFYSLA